MAPEPSRWKKVLRKLSLRRRSGNLPPGPKPIPILGNLHKIDPVNPHHSFHSFSLIYGPIMLVRMGSSTIVVASSPEMAQQFLTSFDHSFASRPATSSGKLLNYNRTDIGWAPYGPYWLQARRICAHALFPPSRLQFFQSVRVQETRALMRGVFHLKPSAKITIRDQLNAASLNMLCRMVIGKKYETEEFRAMMAEFFVLNGTTDIGEVIPWLGFLDLKGNLKKMKKVSKRCDAFWEKVLKEHEERRQGTDGFVPVDTMDVLLQLSEDSSLEVKLQRDGVKGFAQDIIAGGTGSSAATVEWAMSELVRHPKILEKAVEELNRVISTSRWVEEEDIPNLPYLTSIVKEAMRLRPIAPLLIPHLTHEPRNVGGYDIPAGTQIFVNVYTIMRDPKVWEHPLEFRPERFLDKPTDVTGEDHRLLPFGTGSRMCPGHVLGLRMVQLMLANLLQGFKWRLPDGTKAEDIDTDEVFGLATWKKVPLVVIAEPRLPAELYVV